MDKLQDLIRANIDAYDGLRESAEEIDDPSIATLFREIVNERSNLAAELQDCVAWNGEEVVDDGSFAAGVHRAWINVRSKLNSGDPHVVLIEAEFGEDHIKHAYEEALKQTAGSVMSAILKKTVCPCQRWTAARSALGDGRHRCCAFVPISRSYLTGLFRCNSSDAATRPCLQFRWCLRQ